MKKYLLLIAGLIAALGLQAQVTAEREVFSTMGDFATSGSSLSASVTMGEAIVGTVSGSSNLSFLQGFQIPNDMSVGIEELLSMDIQLSVFPNPAVAQLNIELTGAIHEPILGKLYDSQGKEISGWSFEIREAGLVHKSVSALAQGTYFLRLSSKSGAPLGALPFIRL